MKTVSRKGVLLFAAAMALVAFVVPSTSSAVSWTPVGTMNVFTSPSFGFTSTTALGTIVSSCANSLLTVDSVNVMTLQVTGATFGGHCTATVAGVALCTATTTGTGFPWTITAFTTTDVRINNLHIDVRFDQTAGSTCPAALVGQSLTLTGSTTSGGTWEPVGDELTFADAEGLVSHSVFGNNPVTTRATFVDTVGSRQELKD